MSLVHPEILSASPAATAGPPEDPLPETVAARGGFDCALSLRHAGPRALRIHYEIQGTDAAPVILVAGGISAHRHVGASAAYPEPGWWDGQVGPGRALDTRRWRVLAIDWLGADGSLDAPIDSADQADAVAAALDHLGVARIAAFVGCSYGAMVGLQFSARHPQRLDRLIAISGADRPHPFASAWRSLQRRIVGLGRSDGSRREALSLARQLAMLSYRTPEEFASRFEQEPRLEGGVARCDSDAYLEACGARYVARTTPAAFLRLSESIDLHRVDPADIRTPIVLVAVEEDRLVPLASLQSLAARLRGRCRLVRFSSVFGHDAFLTEPARIGAILDEALSGASA